MSSMFRSEDLDEGAPRVLGAGRYAWAIGPGRVDLSMPPPPPLNVAIEAAPVGIEVDLRRAAIVVIDMQNNFCAPGGLTDQLGFDLAPERAPIAPLRATLPRLREVQVPVI